MAGSVFIKGDRINLKTIEKEDLVFFKDNINDPSIRYNLTIRFPINKKEEERWIEYDRKDSVDLAIYKDEEPIGVISLVRLNKDDGNAEVGLWVTQEKQGKGYGTEAARLIVTYGFDELRLHRIYARFYEGNESSKKIWDNFNFKKEGTLRGAAFRDGEYIDIHIYGILENEWKN
ncbi:MAG: GNAT family N-acetyltransferase [Thermoplasmatota archaeon]